MHRELITFRPRRVKSITVKNVKVYLVFSRVGDLAPYIFVLTIVVSAVIAHGWPKKDFRHPEPDNLIALFGFILGLFITFLNFIYSNHYLITLGPILTLACALYLRYRDRILVTETAPLFNIRPRIMKVINVVYWICLTGAILIYYLAPVYTRPPLFFVSISLCVALLGLEMVTRKPGNNFQTFIMIGKMLLLSLVLRGSAYYISPYPVGQDPWTHAEYIKQFLYFAHVEIRPDFMEYYLHYPLMHLYGVITGVICNISVKDSMFVIGAILALSSIFVYFIVKCLTNNMNIALFAVLLVNFADFHIQWSIEVIAMTFGIALYTIVLYLVIKNWKRQDKVYQALLLLYIFLIIWTHTVTTYIALVSLFALAIGGITYPIIYSETNGRKNLLNKFIIAFFLILLFLKWTDPAYPFLEGTLRGLKSSITAEAEFLGRVGVKFAAEKQIGQVLNIVGFILYIAFGVFGCLCCLSKIHADKAKVSLVVMISVLFFVFFAFPLMGIRNILPYRWPAFIYITLVLFAAIGLLKMVGMLQNQRSRLVILFLLLFCASFFMTTNFVTNMDSPIYQEGSSRKSVVLESEMHLCQELPEVYTGYITTDGMVVSHCGPYSGMIQFDPSGEVNWEQLQNNLVVWRECTLTRPVYLGDGAPPFPLGKEFKEKLDLGFNCLYDIGSARAYLNNHTSI